ncbi:hypothetical protein PLICRDRAFT_554795 [Plicaturopsis crispa FD-325 SS-3]|nr:hypothetical protein PLICRDRAFT_554795 [Plicaturopsis crispa FD-325 SS-3]
MSLFAFLSNVFTLRTEMTGICPVTGQSGIAHSPNGKHFNGGGQTKHSSGEDCRDRDVEGTDSHEWIKPEETDSRSPCPALNTLANHGYLPRNGTDISIRLLVDALVAAYALTLPLAILLAAGGFLLLLVREHPFSWPFMKISLQDLAKHNAIEHDASLAHDDADGAKFAPSPVNHTLLAALIEDVPGYNTRISESELLIMSAQDIASARVHREAAYDQPLDPMHAEIARGEMAIVLGMFSQTGLQQKVGIPVEWLREWIAENRLPAEWLAQEKKEKTGLIATVMRSRAIRNEMNRLHAGGTDGLGRRFVDTLTQKESGLRAIDLHSRQTSGSSSILSVGPDSLFEHGSSGGISSSVSSIRSSSSAGSFMSRAAYEDHKNGVKKLDGLPYLSVEMARR